MKINEVIKIDELAPQYVNQVVDKKSWKKLGTGMTATVWQHIADPNTVVKLAGGGNSPLSTHERNNTIAFVQFCVEHGHESIHFPILHGINVDDPEVVQIRLEKLVNIKNGKILRELENVSSYWGTPAFIKSILNLDRELQGSFYGKTNSVASIYKACQILCKWAPHYQKLYGLQIDPQLDLHAGNWMARADGTIVAVDPWYSGR